MGRLNEEALLSRGVDDVDEDAAAGGEEMPPVAAGESGEGDERTLS